MDSEHMKQGNLQRPFLANDSKGHGLTLYSGLPLEVQEQHVKRRYGCKPSSIVLSVSTWLSVSFRMTVFGAIVADSYWGKYKTILISFLVLVVGLATIAISSTTPSLRPPPCEHNSCISATHTQKLVFFSGLYVSAIACGGVKSTLLTFGAEQFDKNQQEKEKASYFSWSYAIINLAMFTAGTVLVWTEERVCWGLGYSICASCTAVAAVIFAMGAPTYRILLPEGSPLTDFWIKLPIHEHQVAASSLPNHCNRGFFHEDQPARVLLQPVPEVNEKHYNSIVLSISLFWEFTELTDNYAGFSFKCIRREVGLDASGLECWTP